MENGVDTLSMLVQWYESAEQASEEGRALAERDRDYRNGTQWTDSEVETLKKRKQPIVTIDRIGPKVDFLLGQEQNQRSDPKAFPRNPQDEEGAAACTDALRFVLDQNRWDRVRSECFDNFIVEGECGADVRIVEKYGEPCIEVVPIMWDRLFYDPHSRRHDYSDAKYVGQFIWMDVDDAVRQWPDKRDAIQSTVSAEAATQGSTYDDVPRLRWSDPKRRRVRIVEMWTREEDGVYYTKFTKGGELERMPSPYTDNEGKPEWGFVFGACNIDRDGNRFGVVRRWISLQDEINKRRSKAMHLLNVRQVKATKGAVSDVNKARAELAKPDGYVEVIPGMELEILPTSDMAAAQFNLLQEAKAEIDAVGVNAALSGTEQRNMSGRALMARQEQGLNELGPVFDRFRQWQLDVYRVIWNRVRQFWTSEKWVRVTDNDDNVKFVGLNRPLTLGEQLLEEAKKQGQQITPEMEQQAKMDPSMQVVVGVRNNVAEMDVDIILENVPASASLQIEQFQTLADLASKGMAIPPTALIKASTLRGKDEILKEMQGGGEIPPQVAQALEAAQQEIQRLQQELQQAQMKSQAGYEAKQLEAAAKIEQTRIQTEAQKEIAVINADQKTAQAELTGVLQAMAKQMDVKLAGTRYEEPKPAEEPKPDPVLEALSALTQTLAQLAAPKVKDTRIVAPSGKVYDAQTVERQA